MGSNPPKRKQQSGKVTKNVDIPDIDVILKQWAWTSYMKKYGKETEEDGSKKTETRKSKDTQDDENEEGGQHNEDRQDIKATYIKEDDKEGTADDEETSKMKDIQDSEDKEEKGKLKKYEECDLVVLLDKLRLVTDDPAYSNEEFTKDPQAQLLYTSSFENDSKLVQNHHFEISEQTTSVVTTTLTKGFTRGDKGIIKLSLPPDVAKSTAHFGKEIIINEDGKKTLRTRSWNAKKMIKAIPEKKTIVNLVVLEKHFKCDFETKVRLRGTARVNIMDLKTGELLEVVQNKINTILKDIKKVDPSKLPGYDVKGKCWTVKGDIEFLYGVEEKTKLWYTDLPTDEEEDSKVREQNGADGDIDEDLEDEFGDNFELPRDDADDGDDDADGDDVDADTEDEDSKINIQSLVKQSEEGESPSNTPSLMPSYVNQGRRNSNTLSRHLPLPGIPSGKK